MLQICSVIALEASEGLRVLSGEPVNRGGAIIERALKRRRRGGQVGEPVIPFAQSGGQIVRATFENCQRLSSLMERGLTLGERRGELSHLRLLLRTRPREGIALGGQRSERLFFRRERLANLSERGLHLIERRCSAIERLAQARAIGLELLRALPLPPRQ